MGIGHDQISILEVSKESGRRTLVYYFYFIVYQCLPRKVFSTPMICYQRGSYLLYETPTKTPSRTSIDYQCLTGVNSDYRNVRTCEP